MIVVVGVVKVVGVELFDYDEVVVCFQLVFGFEVYVELFIVIKMFCGCIIIFGGELNIQVCLVCLGLFGLLLVFNWVVVELVICIGLVLNCEIVFWCCFVWKNYFYFDMFKNYQILQYDELIVINGYLDVFLEDGIIWWVEIE